MEGTQDVQKGNGIAVKRAMSRRFNDVLAGRTRKVPRADQRTARKLKRYRNELRKGVKNAGNPLSPLDVALRVHELLEHGDRIGDIRQLVKPREIDYDDEKLVGLLREMHEQYGFCPEAYRFAGVRNETLVAAGILSEVPSRRGPRKRTASPSEELRA